MLSIVPRLVEISHYRLKRSTIKINPEEARKGDKRPINKENDKSKLLDQLCPEEGGISRDIHYS